MPNIGNLQAVMTADHAEFTAGCNRAAESVDRLGWAGTQTHSSMEKFNFKMLASRHAVGTFAAATGQAVGPLMHLVHAFTLAPNAIGAALVGVLLFKDVLDRTAEAQKKNAEAVEKHCDSLRKQLELEHKIGMGGIRTPSEKTKEIDEQIAAKQAEIKEFNAGAKIYGVESLQEYKDKTAKMGGEVPEEVTHFYTMRAKAWEELNKLTEDKEHLKKTGQEYGEEKGGPSSSTHYQAAIGGRAAEVFKVQHESPELGMLRKINESVKDLKNKPARAGN